MLWPRPDQVELSQTLLAQNPENLSKSKLMQHQNLASVSELASAAWEWESADRECELSEGGI